MSITPEKLLTQLNWRYATKKFDSAKKIPADVWAVLEESLVLAPSSYGLQPWKFFHVQNPDIRKQLLPVSWGQTQVVDASHLVVFCVKKDVGVSDAERLIQRTSELRGIHSDSLAGYLKMMSGSLTRQSPEAVRIWMTNQVFIALGQFLSACALLGVDACPMEGFDPVKFDEILGLKAHGVKSFALAAAGYRAADDKYASLPKVRFPENEVIVRV